MGSGILAATRMESKQILVVHPGSGGRENDGERRDSDKVVQWWRESGERDVLIVLGPAEAEEEDYWRRCGLVETSLELAQIASILIRASRYIGNDSGVSHLAGAVGAQGVVIFGPTRPEQWHPLGGGTQGHQKCSIPREMAPTERGFH